MKRNKIILSSIIFLELFILFLTIFILKRNKNDINSHVNSMGLRRMKTYVSLPAHRPNIKNITQRTLNYRSSNEEIINIIENFLGGNKR